MGTDVFLDTSYALTLSSASDEHHARAVKLAEQIEAAGTRLVTTRAVLLEIGNSLARRRFRAAGVALLASLESDPTVEIVSLSDHLYQAAFQLYRSRGDKEWGLVDCASFIVMGEHGLTEALTTDEHFEQAGFRPLLR